MRSRTNLILGLTFVGVILLAAFQGTRVNRLRESDQFFRWMVSAATQSRLDIPLEFGQKGPDDPEAMDDELYQEVRDLAEEKLPPLEITQEEAEGLPKLERYGIVPEIVKMEEKEDVYTPDPVELRRRNKILWAFARSNAAAPLRNEYFDYLRHGRLDSVGSQYDLTSLYGGEDTMVSLSNLFFGFRKMAANLLWLQADKMWHAGDYYRMVPIMRTTVALDPSFIDAYLIGAWHMAYNATASLPVTPVELRRYDPEFNARVGEREAFYYRAIDFLEDGIRKNPDNYKLYFDLGFAIYGEKLDDQAKAVKWLSEAIKRQHDRWVPRMLYQSMRKNGQYEEAIAGYKDYLEKHPENPNVPRLIKYCEALLAEVKAAKATERMQAAMDLAKDARAEAETATEQGDIERAEEQKTIAEKQDQTAASERQTAQDLRNEAVSIWQSILDTEGRDPLAVGHIVQMQALDMVAQERYVEARALLDYARFETDELFEDLSNLIIDIKLKEGAELNLSEKKARMRQRIDKVLADKHFDGKTYHFRDDGWYQEEYRGQSLTELKPESPAMAKLKQEVPQLDEILALANLGETYPDVEERIDLSNRVVFAVDGEWYLYRSGMS